jgi:DNA-binding transcriptional MerR regulator
MLRRVKKVTTGATAEAVGISRATLQAWIANGTVRAPKAQIIDGVAVRIWTDADLQRLRGVKAKVYRKGRGRKPRAKK